MTLRTENPRRDVLVKLTSVAVSLMTPVVCLARREAEGRRYPPIPPAYRQVARTLGIPAAILYGVAIQESVLLWRSAALPWPWTLNVRAVPRRFANYADAVAELRRVLAQGVRNVDCGTMQVNWHYHSEKLRSPNLALDPWHNLTVAASILQERRAETSNWFEAVGAYHSPADRPRADRYAKAVFAQIARIEP